MEAQTHSGNGDDRRAALTAERAYHLACIEELDALLAADQASQPQAPTAEPAGYTPTEGPSEGRGFLYNGETFDGLTKSEHQLLGQIWYRRKRPVPLNYLRSFSDHAKTIRLHQVERARTGINKFFRQWALPFVLQIVEGCILIASVDEKPPAKPPAKVRAKPPATRDMVRPSSKPKEVPNDRTATATRNRPTSTAGTARVDRGAHARGRRAEKTTADR